MDSSQFSKFMDLTEVIQDKIIQAHGKEKKRRTNCQIQIISNRGINTVHIFLCMHNVACVHVMFMVVTMHTICEGLHKKFYFAAEQDSVCIRKKQLSVN